MTTITTNLDAEITKAKKQAAEKIAKLKRAAAAEQRRIDERVLDLLRTKKPEVYEQFVHDAKAVLDMEKAQRSTRAKKATPSSSNPPEDSAAESTDDNGKEQPSWNM